MGERRNVERVLGDFLWLYCLCGSEKEQEQEGVGAELGLVKILRL